MKAPEFESLKASMTESLAKKGLLNHLKASLRAAVLASLNEDSIVPEGLLTTRNGQILVSLIAEFLELTELKQTLVVFEPESNLTETRIEPKSLAASLNLKGDKPLLLQLLEKHQAHQTLSIVKPESIVKSAPLASPTRPPPTAPVKQTDVTRHDLDDTRFDELLDDVQPSTSESEFLTSDRSITPTKAIEGLDYVEIVE